MPEYKSIKGLTIQEVASDPPAPIEGQVWYNTTTSALKGYINNPGSWATGGDLNTAKRTLGSAGTQTAALAFGGNTPPGTAQTESYNGTNWTELNDLNTARAYLSGAGTTNTAALAFGGFPSTGVTESWNGTNWTEVNDL